MLRRNLSIPKDDPFLDLFVKRETFKKTKKLVPKKNSLPLSESDYFPDFDGSKDSALY